MAIQREGFFFSVLTRRYFVYVRERGGLSLHSFSEKTFERNAGLRESGKENHNIEFVLPINFIKG